MFHIILLNPEIPPNTGNLIRLSANTGVCLHIAGEAGFSMADKHLRRAGLDYHECARVCQHDTLEAAFTAAGDGRRFATAATGETRFDTPSYRHGDIFLFGCESTGLPEEVLASFTPQTRLYIPMQSGNRSFNLSNSAAVIIMEAWRQQNFTGGERED